MNAHYYEFSADSVHYKVSFFQNMGHIIRIAAATESPNDDILNGTDRQAQAWIWRLMMRAKTFTGLKRLHATTEAGATPLPAPPPNTLIAPIGDDGTVGEPLELTVEPNKTYIAIVRTPLGRPPPPAARDALKARRFFWNPHDARGNKAYPTDVWIRHSVPAADLQSLRKLVASIMQSSQCELQFDYQEEKATIL